MKQLCLALASLVAFSVQAADWKKELECNRGEAVVDGRKVYDAFIGGPRVLYQLVIRNQNAITWLAKHGHKTNNFINERGELIVHVFQDIMIQKTTSFISEGVFNPRSGLTTYVGASLTGKDVLEVKIYEGAGVTRAMEHPVANWIFTHCTYRPNSY